MNDHELLAATMNGDDQAFRELFQRHAGWMAGRLQQILPADVVEDVLQETFLAVWRSADRYQSEGEVGAWLWGVARRQAALWYRQQKKDEPVLNLAGPRDPADVVAVKLQLDHAFEGLADEEARELARLALVEQRPLREIAAHFRIPVGTGKSRLYKIRKSLQKALRKEEKHGIASGHR